MHLFDTIIWDEAFIRRTIVDDTLSLSQTIQAGKGRELQQSLGLQEAWEHNNDFNRTVTQQLNVNHAGAPFIESRCGRVTNNRFDGFGAIAPEAPRLRYRSKLTLASDTDSVVLRNPETDDRARYAFTRVNRETYGGRLDVFADPIWPTVQSLLFTVVAVKSSWLQELNDFLVDTVGDEITIMDWEGVHWRGVVMNPDESAVEDGEGYWTITMEFEGYALPGPTSGNAAEFEQDISVQGDYVRTLEQVLEFDDQPILRGPIFLSVTEQIPFQSGV